MTESYSPDDRLSELLEYVHNYTRQRRFVAIGAIPPLNDEPFEHIKYASQAFLAGALPDAKTLAFIAYKLDKYIRNAGSQSLDEAFGLKSKPKAGNPSKQYSRRNHINGMLFDMAFLRAEDSSLSIERASAMVCKNDPDEKEQATLARRYKREKWKEVEEKLRGK